MMIWIDDFGVSVEANAWVLFEELGEWRQIGWRPRLPLGASTEEIVTAMMQSEAFKAMRDEAKSAGG